MELSSRQKEIMQRLHQSSDMLLSAEITSLFDVTVQTIRRDLNELSELGLVRRVHGGIKLPASNQNVSFNNRTVMNLAAKQRIARKVVELLPENASVFLGIGTTPQQVAEELVDHPGLTVVTNNLNVALTLCKNHNIQTYIAGGSVRPRDQDMMGPETTAFMQQFNIQYGVFGVGGLNRKGQLLDFTPEEADVSRCIVANSEQRVLIADHSKLDRYAPVITGVLRDVDMLIMDTIPAPMREMCLDLDIECFEVGPESRQQEC